MSSRSIRDRWDPLSVGLAVGACLAAVGLAVALYWLGAPPDEAPQPPIAAARTARPKERVPEDTLPWGEAVDGLQHVRRKKGATE